MMDFTKNRSLKAFSVSTQRRETILQIGRYGISGVTGALVQISTLYFAVDRIGFWYMHGVVIAFMVSLTITFLLQKFWTFRDYSLDTMQHQSFRYILIAIGALVLNVVCMYILVDVFHAWHLLAQCVVVVIVGTITFSMNRVFTFR